jgi:hypothetical protein
MIEIKLNFTAKGFKAVKRSIMVQFVTSSDGGILYQFAKKVIIAIDDGETEVQIGKRRLKNDSNRKR